MQQLASFWMALDNRRRFIVMFSVTAVFVSMLLLSKLATTPNYALLYSGLSPEASGEVVQSLEQQAVEFEIRGSSIYVESTRRDELRMTLATNGLPTSDGKGYELLDGLSGFGTTAQMFDAAYWRAKEGELARTIVGGAQIRTARVHISNSSSKPFQRNSSLTASVTATGVSGVITPIHAKALRYLIASAVAGLSPEHVAVIDGRNGVVVSNELDLASGTNGNDRADKLKKNIERLLEARVGAGNVIVEINLESVTEREAITEIRIDPDGRVAISSDSEERTTNSKNSGGNTVTVASNLPNGDAENSNRNSSSQNSETRERINYEVSETRREILRIPGATKRISTAVLIDGEMKINDQTGEQEWVPRSADEIEALKELVAAAVGFDANRGDTLTLKSMEFDQISTFGEIPPTSLVKNFNLDVMRLIQVAALSIVTLILGLFVLRPIFSAKHIQSPPAQAIAGIVDKGISSGIPQSEINPIINPSMEVLNGEIDHNIPMNSPTSAMENPSVAMIAAPPAPQGDPVEKLRQVIENRQDETVEILRNWIENGEETA